LVASISRTHGPIHFEDLDPKRFEDLVRQLVYDMRAWTRIEATGRSGSDEGFDIRATEGGGEDETSEDDNDEPRPSLAEERLWLIQCKRVAKLTPAAAEAELEKISEAARGQVYGIGFVVACDLSIATRDRIRTIVRSWGVAEYFIWSRGELEDNLLQPKNDHLLFGFFGVSYQTRRRSLTTAVRSRLAAKKKLQRFVHPGREFLLRDASDERYPWRDEGGPDDWMKRGRWAVREAEEYIHDGLTVLARECCAVLDDDGKHWDYVYTFNFAGFSNDPWRDDDEEREELRQRLLTYWRALPDTNKANFRIVNVLPFDAIIAVDEIGDDVFRGPIVFTTEWRPVIGAFSRTHDAYIGPLDSRVGRVEADAALVVPLFPKEFGSAGHGGTTVQRF
jgi:hypothetical protein